MAAVLLVCVLIGAVSEALGADIGTVCEEGPPAWYCREPSDCTSSQELTGTSDERCASTSDKTLVCCQPNNVTTSGREENLSEIKAKAEKMCKHYGKYAYKSSTLPDTPNSNSTVDTCPRKSADVIKDDPAKPKEFSHMVIIGYGNKSNIRPLCEGNLISERFVLSAAHCAGKGDTKATWATLGDFDPSTDKDDAHPVIMKITEHYLHPDYKGYDSSIILDKDLALFKLEKDVPLGEYIKPICLTTKETPAETELIVTGYGLRVSGGRGMEVQKSYYQLLHHEKCKELLAKERIMMGPGLLCGSFTGGSKETFMSGSPVQLPMEDLYCMYSLIGFASYSIRPDSAGFTSVIRYLPWIVNTVWP